MFSFGIVHLDIVPVRAEPSDKAEQVSQLRFGEVVEVLATSENQKWLHIQNFLDKYMGWVDVLQIKPISENFFELYKQNLSTHAVVSSIHAQALALDEKKNFLNTTWLSKGAILPFYQIRKDKAIIKPRDTYFFEIDSTLFRFRGKVYEKQEYANQEVISRALAYQNAPYLWGGKSFWGIDCSGFVQEVWKTLGVFLPRDAYQQAEFGTKIAFSDLKTADVAFFQRENRVIHTGIVWVKNKVTHIIHARGRVRVDKLDEKGILDVETHTYSHFNHSFRRII
ncbi:C40 family peptidase [Raineya sp.]|jgi:hypothetical protein